MTPAKEAWRQTRHLQTRSRVGRFYNKLAAKVIGGKTNGHVHDSRNTQFADAWNPEVGVGVESKASSGGHNWRFSLSQVSVYHDARPMLSYCYFLASYKTVVRVKKGEKKMRGRKGGAYSMLARIERIADQYEFLSKQTDEVYLLDLLFLRELQERGIGKVTEGAFGNREGSRTLELRRSDIRPFRNPTRDTLSRLGFSADKWVFRRFDMELRFSIILETPSFLEDDLGKRSREVRIDTSFPLYTVLSPELDRKLHLVIENSNDAGLPF